jgi:hypothetical protein
LAVGASRRQLVESGRPAISAATADPDRDGVRNLAEFAMGGDPLVPDGSKTALQVLASAPGTFTFSFRERKNLGDVQRRFERSSDLANWVEVVPSNLSIVSNLPDAFVRAAVFPAQNAAAYFRLRFSLQTTP